ncbi:hypothetical protein BRCON_1410 [Candidatus Sumerlaea chitinivorans]|uniref:Uncharacterized protein n=1 Tax=Sumerlaea chitinivorans TaxID=2250252 RepID=A0A2Z4Y4R2_SUMC1|nr:hypothetical protein BRCON_1410 [Candidatus Sumerlaea chitinivorans]
MAPTPCDRVRMKGNNALRSPESIVACLLRFLMRRGRALLDWGVTDGLA